MQKTTEDLIRELRATSEWDVVNLSDLCHEAADALERLQHAWEVEMMANSPRGDVVQPGESHVE